MTSPRDRYCESCGRSFIRGNYVRHMATHDDEAIEMRFWSKVDMSGDCWLWTGAKNTEGYGYFYIGQRAIRAHRFAYELIRGPIPAPLLPDHLCKNPSCVRPAHLELVPERVNILRGDSPSALNTRKTHCPQGHPYEGDNLYVAPSGFRKCRTCMYAGHKAWRARKSA